MFNTETRFRAMVCVIGIVLAVAGSAAAQELVPASALEPAVLQAAAFQSAVAHPLMSRTATARRPSALVPLYVSFGVMQALDMHSTHQALAGGAGRESNPLVGATLGSPIVMASMKAGTTAGIIFLTEKVRKRHPVAAVVMMVGLNSAYATIVSRNYSIARRGR